MKPRFAALALLMLSAAPARAEPDVMALVRADRWTEALGAAAAYTDPVAAKLVTYYRLLAPNAATAGEISAFMAVNPDWPLQAALARRRDEALALEPDDGVVRAECTRTAPTLPSALQRCAAAFASGGDATQSARFAGLAWAAFPGDAAGEQRFLQQFGPALTAADQRARFDRLVLSDLAAADRQAARLDPSDRAVALARLGLRRGSPNTPALLTALSAKQRGEPELVLDEAAAFRRAGQDDSALALWLSRGAAVEQHAEPARAGAFWNERNILARRRLRQGDAKGAYGLAAGYAGSQGEAQLDAAFLAGFVALRMLNDPGLAEPHFRHLLGLSQAAITQGRGHYWLGRTAQQRGDAARAQAEYQAAAQWPNVFYGQLGALRGGMTDSVLASRIAGAGNPPADAPRTVAFAGRELARAAAYLINWGETRRAQAFLLRLDDIAPDATDRSLVARLALGFGLPETAVALARRTGRDGLVPLATGWPQPVSPPTMPDPGPEPALSLAIIRQESSFDGGTVSPVGARGLMQLMPGTAAQEAKRLGIQVPASALTTDTGANMRLGAAYLGEMLARYAGCTPLAVAAYNAGPARVDEWLGTNGDPRGSGVDMLDWIELIPFNETRNYVQRVVENEVVYRALRGEAKPHPLAEWLR